MWPIALSTFKEVYRKRVVHVIGLLTLLYWGILGYVIYMQPREFHQSASLINALINLSSLISILGFYLSSMLLAFLTIMLSVGIISSEVEDGTVLTILTKPIPRASYVLGKYVGISLLIVMYAAILYVGIILFALIGKQNFVQIFGLATLGKGFLLFTLQPLALAALAVFGSTVFKTVNNGIFVIALYLLGIIGGIMEQVGSLAKIADLSTFGIVASLFAPFEVIYRKMISIIFSKVGGFNLLMGMTSPGTSVEPSGWMMVYVAVYMLGLICWGVRRMNRKDIG